MSRTLLIAGLYAGFFGVTALAVSLTAETVGTAPSTTTNVLFIVVDTLRADHLEPYGYKRPTSPELRAFGEQAAVFDRAYSHAPWTMPSVASMFTSLTPRDHGIVDWKQPLDKRFVTLAEHLRDNGFQTSAVVSHVVFNRKMRFQQGFESYDLTVLDKGNPHKVTSSAEVTDGTIAWLDARDESRPFFAWAHYFDPHVDYVNHPDWDWGESKIGRYDSEIGYTDRHVGRLLAALDERDLSEDTIVVFTADHGEEFKDHGYWQHSNTLYNEVVRVPLMIRGPGVDPQRVPDLLGSMDVAPTVLAMVGLESPAGFQGAAVPLNAGRFEPGPDRSVFMETQRFADKRALVQGDYKVIRDLAKDGAVELYDVTEDRREKTNVADALPQVRDRMLAELDAYYAIEHADVEERELDSEELETLELLGYLEPDAEPK